MGAALVHYVLFALLINGCFGAFCSNKTSKIDGLFITDYDNRRIRLVSPINVYFSTLAGNGTIASIDGYGTSTSLKQPQGIAFSRNGDYLYISDSGCIRSVYLRDGFFAVNTVVGYCSLTGNVDGSVSVAKLGASLFVLSDIGDKGLFIADSSNRKIKYFDFNTKILSTFIGSGGSGCGETGSATSIAFHAPRAMYVSKNRDYFLFSSAASQTAIYYANLSTMMVTVFAGNCAVNAATVDGVGTAASVYSVFSIVSTSDESKIYVADGYSRRIRVITLPGAVVTTLFDNIAFASTSLSLYSDDLTLYTVGGYNYYTKVNLTSKSYVMYTRPSGFADGPFSTAKVGSETSISVGYVYNFSECSKCNPGEYQNTSELNFLSCIKCPTGKYSFGDSPMCNDCATASSGYGLLACKNCGIGTYASLDNASNVVCQVCNAGTYMPTNGSSVCLKCTAGKYGTSQGASVCVDCGVGSYSTAVGASVCMNCLAGGYASFQGATTCTNCSAGSYSSLNGAEYCAFCGSGTYSLLIGATSSVVCTKCDAGTYSSLIGAGSSLVCTNCAAGSYMSEDGGSACLNCTAGNYSGSGASVCTECDAGFVSQDGAESCTLDVLPVCWVGSYGKFPDCNPCPPNTNSSVGNASTILDCRCLAGFVCTYTKRISVVLTLHEITWNMTTIAGLSQSAVIDAIAQAAGVARGMVVINGMFTGRRRLLGLGRRHKMFITVSGAESFDVGLAYELLGVKAHIAWEHKHALRVAREFTE